MPSSDSDSDEYKETGEEKCRFDNGLGIVVGSLILWPFSMSNDQLHTRSKPIPNSFPDIPTAQYLQNIAKFDWLDDVRKHVYCLIRAINFEQKAGSTGIRLSPNTIGTTRHTSELGGGLYPFNMDSVARNVIDLSEFRNFVFTKNLIDTTMYTELTGASREFVPYKPNKLLIDTPFDFTIISAQKPNMLPKELPVFPTPSPVKLTLETPIIVMGYPQLVNQKKLDASYGKGESKPSVEDVNNFFAANWKTASLGVVKYTNGRHALITAATCSGMSGSPVFTFSGDLVGVLTGSKPGCSFNIIMLVSHPTFIVEYCTHCGSELMDLNPTFFGPKLAPFVSNHLDILTNAALIMEQPDNLNKFMSSMECYLK